MTLQYEALAGYRRYDHHDLVCEYYVGAHICARKAVYRVEGPAKPYNFVCEQHAEHRLPLDDFNE